MKHEIKVELRNKSAKATRAEGLIPAVVYGAKMENTPISVSKTGFEALRREASESTIISLTGLEKEVEALIHDVSFLPLQGGVAHVDFMALERGKELEAEVSFEFVGEAPVTKHGATVIKVMHGVEVTCLPKDLPEHIEVDISKLVSDDSHILMSDIKIPKGVTVHAEMDAVIATVSAARTEEEIEEDNSGNDAVPEEVKDEAEAGEGKEEDSK